MNRSIVDGSKVDADLEDHADVVIVGSGAGGAVLAKELAEGGAKVMLLEEGPDAPTKSHTDLPHEAISRLYRNQAFTTTFGKPFIPVPLGRVLGGTTVINSGTCFRTPERVLNHWSTDLGLSSLTSENFQPYFERVEREIHVSESKFEVMSRSNKILHNLLLQKKIPGKPLQRNVKNCEGCGFCCYGCPSGAKQSMDVSYLPKAFAAGARAITQCRVEKILFSGNKARGVIGRFLDESGKPSGKSARIEASKVILSGGAVLTPLLLHKNKIARWNRNVGRHLTLHPATKLFAQFDEDVLGWEGTPQAYYLDLFQNEGMMFEGVFMPPDVAAMTVPFVGRELADFMLSYRHMATFGFLVADSTEGRVMRLPFFDTCIFYNLTPTDAERIRKGVLFLSRVFLEGGAKKVITLIHGFPELSSEADLQRLAKAKIRPKEVESMAFHPLGSCRMAATPKNGVVGEDHQIFDYEGLTICDGSIIPSALGVNPQVTIMAFATRLASQLLNKNLR